MAYSQAVNPDLNTVGNIGWCLSFVENVFNTPHLYATATDGWHSTHFPHQDRNFPAGVYVPVWFSYIENGLDFGHVAVHAPDGRVLSSPYAQEDTHVWFPNIAQCEAVLNCKYLGWSEDLAGVRIIKGEDMFEKGDAENIVPALTGRPIDEGGYGYAGMSWHDAIYGILASPSFNNYVNQIPELQAKVDQLTVANLKLTDQLQALKSQPTDPNSVVVSKDGLWASFKKFLGL